MSTGQLYRAFPFQLGFPVSYTASSISIVVENSLHLAMVKGLSQATAGSGRILASSAQGWGFKSGCRHNLRNNYQFD
jgi:hypothetical protein